MRKLKLEELNRVNLEEFANVKKTPIVIVADNIRSAMNIGSLFRTADSFAIEELILCGISATPPHKEIMKTAIGASKSVKWQYENDVVNAVKSLKERGYVLVGVEQTSDSKMLDKLTIDPSTKFALILGNEVNGVSDAVLPLLDYAVEIPQFGTKHSLNVSVCAGIVIWEYWCQINKTA